MSDVICFCGASYTFDGQLGPCPRCDEVAVIPQVSDRDLREMEAELAMIIDDHGVDNSR